MKIELRAATSEDAATVALLGRITFSETFGYLFERHPKDLADYLHATFGTAKIRDSLTAQENSYWLACADELPVGYAKLKQPSGNALLPGTDAAQLQKIYVLRDFLGQGIGPKLLNECLARARSLRAPAIWLSVLRENVRAIAFYRRHGFSSLGPHDFTIGAQTFGFDTLAAALR